MLTKESLGADLGLDLSDLWPHQPEAVDFIVKHGRIILPLPTGCGKTWIDLLALRWLMKHTERHCTFPLLILCSASAVYTWKKQITKYIPELANDIHILEKKMKGPERLKIWNGDAKIIIAKAKTWQYDHPKITRRFQIGIFDEYHRWFRKRSAKIFDQFKDLTRDMRHCWWVTATPISKGRQDIWPVLHLCQPRRFTSYWRFVGDYCHVVRGEYGMEILGPRRTTEYKEATADIVFRLSKPIEGMPQIVRQTLVVEMTPQQQRVYAELSDNMVAELDTGGYIITSSVLATITRLRQLTVCPAILDPSLGYGAGIEAVLDHMEEEKEVRSHCVWYTPWTAAIPHMEAALREAGYTTIHVFRGGMSSTDIEAAEEGFRRDPNSVAIVSIAFAQSFELETGNPGYFIGYSFDPNDNYQAEGRQKRMTIAGQIRNMYYVQNMGTYDDHQLEILDSKTMNTRVDMNDIQAIRRMFSK